MSSVFLINLERSKDRLAFCREQLEQLNVNFTRIEAVDGAKLSTSELSNVTAPLFSGYYKELSRGEIGCYLSHIKCWREICEQQLDYAVILEDDVVLQPNFYKVRDYIEAIEVPWDCIKLAEQPEKRHSIKNIPLLDKTLVRYDKIPSRTCAYVITHQGARKMLQTSKTISRPVDIDFQYWWEKSILVYGLKPYPVKVNQDETSTIDGITKRKSIRKSVLRQYTQMIKFNWLNKVHLDKIAKGVK